MVLRGDGSEVPLCVTCHDNTRRGERSDPLRDKGDPLPSEGPSVSPGETGLPDYVPNALYRPVTQPQHALHIFDVRRMFGQQKRFAEQTQEVEEGSIGVTPTTAVDQAAIDVSEALADLQPHPMRDDIRQATIAIPTSYTTDGSRLLERQSISEGWSEPHYPVMESQKMLKPCLPKVVLKNQGDSRKPLLIRPGEEQKANARHLYSTNGHKRKTILEQVHNDLVRHLANVSDHSNDAALLIETAVTLRERGL